MNDLPRALPSQKGVPPQFISDMVQEYINSGLMLQSYMVVKDGCVISEGWFKPYSSEYRHMMFSITKGFTSLATGMAIDEGLISLDDKVIDFFPDKLACEPCENMQKLKIKHLLTMTVGQDYGTFVKDAKFKEDFIKYFLTYYVENEPGSVFLYNNASTCVLAAIIERRCGQSLEEYLKPRLFNPLCITDYVWEKSHESICYGAMGLSIKTEDMAKYGQLLLQNGRYNGKQLVRPDYLKDATSMHIIQPPQSPDWNAGYGYQYFLNAREDSFRSDGAFGQLCVVVPKHNLVVVTTAGLYDMQKEMDIMFDKLICRLNYNVAASLDGQDELDRLNNSLCIKMPDGNSMPESCVNLSGKRLRVSKNPYGITHIKFDIKGNNIHISFYYGDEEVKCSVGFGEWCQNQPEQKNSMTAIEEYNIREFKFCAGAWNKNIFKFTIVYPCTPFVDEFEFDIRDDFIIINLSRNVSFEERDWQFFAYEE